MTLFTRTVFLDDTSILSKLDPGTWPERRTSHDEIAQASEHFLSCRFDPDDLEAQLAKLSHFGIEQERGVKSGSTRRNLCPESTFGEPLFSWLGVPPRRLLQRSQMFPMMGPPILPNRVGQSRSHTDRLHAIGAPIGSSHPGC